MTEHADYEEDQPVYVLYPLDNDDLYDRSTWHWMPGYIVHITTDHGAETGYAIAVNDDPIPDPDNEDELTYPVVFRDATEVKPRKENIQ